MNCEYCGAEIEDPSAGFVEHLEQSEPCREQFEATSDAAIKDSGNLPS